MTDTTHEAPERIWAWGWRVDSVWQEQTWQHEDEPISTMEYVRADLVQAAVAAALRDAAGKLKTEALFSADIGATDQYLLFEEVRRDVLALITPDAQAALDRVVAAERERCAKIVENHCEYVRSSDNSRQLDKRTEGDRMGLGYAAAIREGGE